MSEIYSLKETVKSFSPARKGDKATGRVMGVVQEPEEGKATLP